MMLESIFTDIAQQLLHLRNFDHPSTAKRLQRIVGKSAASYVSANLPRRIVRRKASKAHCAGLHLADTGTKSIFLANGAGDNRLVIHVHFLKEMLRQVAAMEAHGLVRMIAVVVVPIKQGAGSFGGQLQGMHAEYPADIGFTRAG